ncbi:MAG: hypothetical protein WA908_10565, partial [Pontixanthobacter sp.]
ADWRILRIDAPMTIHDADMHHPRQWWLRAIRSGFGYAQVWHATRHGSGPALYRREVMRALFWTLGVFLIGIVAAIIVPPWGILAAPALWTGQLVRLSGRMGLKKSAHLLAGKFAESIGIVRFAAAMLRNKRQGAIFYK